MGCTVTVTAEGLHKSRGAGDDPLWWFRGPLLDQYDSGKLKDACHGQIGMESMSGPVGIVDVVQDTYNQSKSGGAALVFLNMLNLMILLSANLGVMNLLPIPALDGGRLVFW